MPCQALQFGLQYGGTNAERSTASEYINRRRLLREEAHKDGPSMPTFEHARFLIGEDERSGAATLSATFRALVATELKDCETLLLEW